MKIVIQVLLNENCTIRKHDRFVAARTLDFHETYIYLTLSLKYLRDVI